MATQEQIRANRENAQHSTGPRTEEGKTRSSMNAVKTGLTGRTVLLPADDAAAYEKHVAHFFQQHQPVGDDEANLVQSLADTEWRLLRIPSLEAGIYALGRIELAAQFAEEDPAVRAALIEAKTFLVYQKQLNNLSIQENRLRRQRTIDLQSLKKLQKDRLATSGSNRLTPSHSVEIGFEFSRESKHPEMPREPSPLNRFEVAAVPTPPRSLL